MQYYKKIINLSGLLIVLLQIISFESNAQTADFSFIKKSNCAPAIVEFTNKSTVGGGISYLWDFGNGAIIASQDMKREVVYDTSGTYTVVLKVINGTDTTTASASITISQGPKASFTIDKTHGCVPLTVAFTNTSTPGDAPLKTTFWDFRNGETSSSMNPTFNYLVPQTYGVFLQVTDENNCSDFIESKDLIKVYPKPQLQFSASDSSSCTAPFLVNFINLSTSEIPVDYTWNFGNDLSVQQFSASTEYISSGAFDVTLSASNDMGCSASLTKENFIVVGEGSGNISILQGDKTFDKDSSVLCPGFARIISTSASGDYLWRMNYNNKIFTSDSAGFYFEFPDSGKVELNLVYGIGSMCPDSVQETFYIDHIRADFQMDNSYSCELPAVVNAFSLSENSDSLFWLLPGGSIATGDTVTSVVPKVNNYSVVYNNNINVLDFYYTLFATSKYGCNDSLTKTFTATLPVARFLPDKSSGCAPLEVTFADSSKSIEQITRWTYSIGNETYNKPITDFKHTFTQPGKYDISLEIENQAGCSDTSVHITIEVGEIPVSSFTVNPAVACYGDLITLNSSSSLEDSIDFWRFSSPGLFSINSHNQSDQTVKVFPSETGTYDITLETSFNGCVSDTTLIDALTINGPVGNFTDTFTCENPYSYSFTSNMDMATSLEWNINGEFFNDVNEVNYTFPATGDFPVSLTATLNTCTVKKNKIIKVRNVSADFIVNKNICINTEAELNASTSKDFINECHNEGFLWKFEDAIPDRRTYDTVFTKYFPEPGVFDITLVVKADNGCEDTAIQSVNVIEILPEMEIDKNFGCAPEFTVNFNYTNPDASIIEKRWIFGDNQTATSTGNSISHEYSGSFSTQYSALLLVTDKNGCTGIDDTLITLKKPVSNFQALDNSICLGGEVTFVPYNTNFDNFMWRFGDGASSNSSFKHVYDSTGDFDVTFIIEQDGCIDSLTYYNYVSVENANAEYTTIPDNFDCYPARVRFQHIQGENIAGGRWQFDQGVFSSSYTQRAEYVYSRPGTYTTSLLVWTKNNCQASFSKVITVNGPYATFDFTPKVICSGDSVKFMITSAQNVDEYRWLFGDGGTSDLESPYHTYFAKGQITPSIEIQNNNCQVTLPSDFVIHVDQITAAFDFEGEKTSFCVNDTLRINNNSTNYQSGKWKINEITVSSDMNIESFPLLLPGNYKLELVVSNNQACADSVSKQFSIVASPSFQIKGDTFICPGSGTSLTIENADTSWNVTWEPSVSLNNATSINPYATPVSSTLYTATVSSAGGCTGEGSFLVLVDDPAVIQRSPVADTFIYIGQDIELEIGTTKESTTYYWSPGYNLSCTDCNNPVASPQEDVIYTVNIKGECYDITEQFPVDVIIDFYLELPGAFSPNGDGINDVLYMETKNVGEAQVKIFNRWGNLVYETNDISLAWDGTTKGKLQPVDTYAYIIEAVTVHGYKFKKKGNFLLLK